MTGPAVGEQKPVPVDLPIAERGKEVVLGDEETELRNLSTAF